MKKTIIAIFAFMLTFPVFCYADLEFKEYINDGKMTLSDKCVEAVLGDIITLSVVSKDFDWQNKEDWQSVSGMENVIEYYDETTADANGKYKFDYYLQNQGEYTLYIGSEHFSQAKKENIVYINEDKNKEAISNLNSATTKEEIEEILKDGKYSLGIYQNLYDEINLENAAKILFDYYLNGGEKSSGYTDTQDLVYKAFMVDLLSTKDVLTMEDYWDCSGVKNELIGKYYDSEYAAQIAKSISEKSISSIADYDDAILYAIAGSAIEYNDNIGNIKNLLLDYHQKIGIEENIITNSLASYLAGKSLYSKESIKKAVSDYLYELSLNSSGGSGSSGGSSGSSSPKISAITYPQPNLPDKDKNADVFSDLYLTPWAEEAVNALYSKGVISGRAEGIFAPKETVLREECAKLITEAFKFYVIGDKLSFVDVPEDSWYNTYVSRAYHAEIIKGFSDTQFGTGYSVTRQDLAVMIYNALNQADIILPQNNEVVIKDDDKIASYARQAVVALCKAGIVSGDENGYFNPSDFAARAETAKILYCALNLEN